MIEKNVVQILNIIAKEKSFDNYRIELVKDELKVKGYLGNILKIRIIKENQPKCNEMLNLVVKVALKGSLLREQVNISELYMREIYLYDTVFPIFDKFAKEKEFSSLILTPQFYKGEKRDNSEIVVLEDLHATGFKIHNLKIPLNHDHVSLILNAYAQLHAFSFAIKDQKPQFSEIFHCTLSDTYTNFIRKGNNVHLVKLHWEKCLTLLSSTLSLDNLKICQSFVERIPQYMNELNFNVDNYSVILHGDPTPKNIMFKYQDNEGASKPTEARLIDFQFSRMGPPTLDLSYFFYNSAAKEVLENLDDYLKMYYNNLSFYLQQLGSNAENVFPYSVFLESWRKNAIQGLIISPPVLHVMLSEEHEIPDFNKTAESKKSVGEGFMYELSNINEYIDRVQFIINNSIKNKII